MISKKKVIAFNRVHDPYDKRAGGGRQFKGIKKGRIQLFPANFGAPDYLEKIKIEILLIVSQAIF